jgi:hypothetical protein
MNTTIRWPRAERLLFLGRNGAEICVPIAALPRLLQALKGIRRPKKRFQVRPSAHVK